MSLEIKNTKDIAGKAVNIMIYGISSAGKTSLLSGLSGKTLIISAEGGLLVLKDSAIDVVEVKNIDELAEVYTLLKSKEYDYENVAIDSLTEIADMIVNDLDSLEYYQDPKNAFVLWKDYSKKLIKIVKMFRDLDANVIFTALEDTVEDNGALTKNASVQGKKAQGKLISIQDEFYRLHINKEGKRILSTDSTNFFLAKSRAGLFEKEYEVEQGSTILGDMLEAIRTNTKLTKTKKDK